MTDQLEALGENDYVEACLCGVTVKITPPFLSSGRLHLSVGNFDVEIVMRRREMVTVHGVPPLRHEPVEITSGSQRPEEVSLEHHRPSPPPGFPGVVTFEGEVRQSTGLPASGPVVSPVRPSSETSSHEPGSSMDTEDDITSPFDFWTPMFGLRLRRTDDTAR
jgi:hypothetical protein